LLQIAADYDEGVGWSGVMTFWRPKGPWAPGSVALLPDQELSQVERQRIDFRTDEAPSIFDPGEVIGAD